jgi:DNA-binding transcriptional ArsR family regulator
VEANHRSAADGIAALGDPRRREIVELLAAGPCSVGELAKQLPVTRSAVSQHLRVLQDAGLVTHQAAGTRHLYRLDPIGVAALRDYLDALWQRGLLSLKAVAEESYRKLKPKRRQKNN